MVSTDKTRNKRPPSSSNQTHGAYTQLESLLQLRFAAQDLSLRARRPAQSLLAGNLRTRFRGRGMDFEEVRRYQAGDDIRSIDWRVTARTQIPHTKLYREERERPLLLVADQRSSMFFGSQHCFKSVQAAHLCSLLAWAGLKQGDRIGALVFGDRQQKDIRPRRSKHAVLELLQQLHHYNHQLKQPVAPGISLQQMLEDSRRLSKPGSAVFIISDFHDWNDDCEQQLFELCRHTDVTLMQIYDVLEAQLPRGGLLSITDGQQRCQLATDQQALRQAFAERFEDQQKRLIAAANRLKIPFLSLSTDDDLISQLHQLYGKKAKPCGSAR